MKRMLWVGVMLAGMVGVAQGQFYALFYYDCDPDPLTINCNGTGGPIPDGTTVEIYWDQNNNGPDEADNLVPQGGGFGECNFNTFSMNGLEVIGCEGGFGTDPSFIISTNTPAPSRYWLRICVPGQNRQWRTNSFTIVDGLLDYDLTGQFICVEEACDACDEPLAAPQIVILPQGNDIVLMWNPVDTTVAGCPVEDKDYLIYVSDSPAGPYDYLAWTSDTAYTDAGVVDQLDQRYYQVTADEGVQFADPNLEQAVREQLGNFDGPLLRGDLAGITYLSATARQISLLGGLEWFSGLERLELGLNQITNIGPLSRLAQLWDLSLSFNQITDLSPIANLLQLQYLSVGDNQISSLGPLSGLSRLVFLHADRNNIADLAPLTNLAMLQSLYLGANQIEDVSSLSNLSQLGTLVLQQNQISDIDPLASLGNLGLLFIDNNQIVNIDALGNTTELSYLNLGANLIGDIGPLVGLAQLQSIDLWSNSITDVQALVDNPGVGSGDNVNLWNNPLGQVALTVQIPELISRGVNVYYGGAARQSGASDAQQEFESLEEQKFESYLNDAHPSGSHRDMLKEEFRIRMKERQKYGTP